VFTVKFITYHYCAMHYAVSDGEPRIFHLFVDDLVSNRHLESFQNFARGLGVAEHSECELVCCFLGFNTSRSTAISDSINLVSKFVRVPHSRLNAAVS